MTKSASTSAALVAFIGLAGLASAMGIGRFAFTPALPLMQADKSLTLVAGSWLASVNYLGYLLGALACIVLTPRPALWGRAGLLVTALVTLAMMQPDAFGYWLAWRLLAGVASAFVLVGLSAWCLEQLAQLGRSHFAGVVYAGVGTGIAVAGLLGLLAGTQHWPSANFWGLLGGLALLVWLLARPWLKPSATQQAATHSAAQRFTADHWRLMLCYSVFGIGYILPATYLPAMARQELGDPTLFGWVWPAFGVAALLSTLLVGKLAKRFAPRKVWAVAALIMTLGVILPVVSDGLVVLLLAALCVGGTFMVMTMAGMQEARACGGPRLIAAMTAGFAAGQIAGPLLVAATGGDMLWPSLLATLLLLASVVGLLVKNTASVVSR